MHESVRVILLLYSFEYNVVIFCTGMAVATQSNKRGRVHWCVSCVGFVERAHVGADKSEGVPQAPIAQVDQTDNANEVSTTRLRRVALLAPEHRQAAAEGNGPALDADGDPINDAGFERELPRASDVVSPGEMLYLHFADIARQLRITSQITTTKSFACYLRCTIRQP